MARVEPVPGEPAALVEPAADPADGESGGPPPRLLVVADYHAGIEAGLRYERGVELASDADGRRERLLSLVAETRPDRVVVLGDLVHRISKPGGEERDELDALLDAVTDRAPVTLVRGNHDGGVADAFAGDDRLDVTPPEGVRVGDVGLLHGHTWPARRLLGADVVCVGHEHPAVRLTDEVGGSRVERAWLRGPMRADPFTDHFEADAASLPWGDPELVVFPAFNDRSGGTWVNVPGQEFLAPFLPAAFERADAYLLDGTRLGDYRRV